MLNLLGKHYSRQKSCKGISRRDAIQIGALGMGGLSLPSILAAEDRQKKKSHKSVIMIYLCGGPPHQDMYDIKVDAPADIRGEFSPISTSIPGIQISEHMPGLAQSMDKATIIRSMVGARDSHYSYQCMTGHHEQNSPAGGWPHFGSAISRFEGPVHPGVPPFVSLCYTTKHRPYNEPGPGFLGLGHSSFRPTGPSRDNLILKDISAEQLGNRKSLLKSFDRFRRNADATGKMEGMDVFSQRAMGILTSSDLFDALDVSKETDQTRERYGEGDLSKPKGDAAPIAPQNFLLARRLIEAGVRVVTVNYSFWDWHSNNFDIGRQEIPVFDKGISALIEDLHERGLSDDVTVCAWGEFGRTPKINKNGGRDHWPGVCAALLAGGGMKHGQVIGSTDRHGGAAADRPVTFSEVFATLYRNLGIDLNTKERLFDFRGQPQHLVDQSVRPIRELI
ncbi:DUF1501 domain-containing protein [Pirellulaceae bacterium]|jgi:hypothetical protein|nr:DUF1501 domain-containing protein [Mariniblastus sp.]MDB4756199.1 DUF1501 domain-containing protein [Mariniblastus sp.]MDB4794179.1 DUF1501 domain-containing protein [Pirellulaceae bacterium]